MASARPGVSGILAHAMSRAGGAIDRGVLALMERRMSARAPRRPPEDARRRLLEIAARYRDAHPPAPTDRFFPQPRPAAARVLEQSARAGAAATLDVSFPSGYRPYLAEYRDEHASYEANLTAHARLYLADPARPRPVAVCLHGWGGGAYWLEERAFLVSYLLRIGLDVAVAILPFHAGRAPAQAPRSGALFPSSHVVRTNEAFGQAVWDVRALAGWLRGRGHPAVGVIGMSLGGYTTALLATVEPTLAFAIPMIPAVSMADLMWRHGKRSAARQRAERAGVTDELLREVFAVHSPLARPPLLPSERLLIVAGAGDRITPPDQAESLWRHWGEPAVHWFPGGHLAQLGRGDGFRVIRRQLTRAGVIP